MTVYIAFQESRKRGGARDEQTGSNSHRLVFCPTTTQRRVIPNDAKRNEESKTNLNQKNEWN